MIYDYSMSNNNNIISRAMEGGNTLFYHGHILTNINKIDERKDKFVQNRRGFLREYCQPIQQKINAVYRQIAKYKQMRDTQEEVIENDADILKIKGEIDQYTKTSKYFQEHVDQYQKNALQYLEYNAKLIARIKEIKTQIVHLKREGEQHYFLPQIVKDYHLKSIHSELKSSSIRNEISGRSKQHTSSVYTVNNNSEHIKHSAKKIIQISEKIQKNNSYHLRPADRTQNQQNSLEKSQIQDKSSVRNKSKEEIIREQMINFDKTQTLFRECFDKKKQAVQKCVSQLQSKLIVNREEFLLICQAIGSKQNNVTFDQFNKLSSDEIMTLFISFLWLNRKLNAQFVAKRKQIMDYIGRLPKIK